ncbi:Fic family protein [Candidatus Pacearchaeota archaeon]|nr:Fic family protein [Candidatus Pacearchaeota archaeon]
MRIIAKKKGNREYYYLQHSFRKGKKVITKEKYLGMKIPKNVDEIKGEFSRDLKKDLYKKLERIKANFQKEWKRLPISVQEKEKEQISIAFTYNSNAIEGSTITLHEAREIIQDKIAPNKPIRDIKETEMHNKVFLDMLKKKEKIGNESLLGWHKEIFGGTKPDIAGKYRNYLVRVGSYIAPHWNVIRPTMSRIVEFVNKSKLNPVELAARAHYKFESIHPFGDGNGRIGRLLMNHILWHAGYPMLIIEYKKRKSYYNAFPKGQEAFVDYFLKRYLAVHKKRYVK